MGLNIFVPAGDFFDYLGRISILIGLLILIGFGFQFKESRELNSYFNQNCQIGKKAAEDLNYRAYDYIVSFAESGKFNEQINISSSKHKELKKITELILSNQDCFTPTNIKNEVLKESPTGGYRFKYSAPVWCYENQIEDGSRDLAKLHPYDILWRINFLLNDSVSDERKTIEALLPSNMRPICNN